MSIEILSLIAIVVAIGIGFWKGINTGLVSIAFALIMGHYLGGLSFTQIIGFWPLKLFFITFGVTLLFSVAKVNGTLDSLARIIIFKSGGRKELIPIIFYLLAIFLASIGPGNISTAALLTPIAITIAVQTNISILMISGILILGSIAGGLSPLAPNGIVALTLAENNGLGYLGNYIYLNGLISITLLSSLIYIALGGLKLRGERAHIKKPDSFNLNQLFTLSGILFLVIWVIFFKVNVGLASFTIVTVLMLLKVADQNKAIQNVPWSTLLLVCGTAILISVADELGGIELLTMTLAKFMGPKTAVPIMAILAGVMSIFSSAVGVVMPTLIPTTPVLANELGNSINPQVLVLAIAIGSHITTPSPLSTMGALALASSPEEVNKNKLFRNLFILAIVALLFIGLLGYLGLINIIK